MGTLKGRPIPLWQSTYERLGLRHLAYDVPVHAQALPYMLGGLSLLPWIIAGVVAMFGIGVGLFRLTRHK